MQNIFVKRSGLFYVLLALLVFTSAMPALANYDSKKVKAAKDFFGIGKKSADAKKIKAGKEQKKVKSDKSKDSKLVPWNDFLSIAEKVEFLLENFEKRFDVYLNEKIALQPFLLPEEVLVNSRGDVKEGKNLKYADRFTSKFAKFKNLEELFKHTEKVQQKAVTSEDPIQKIIEDLKKELQRLQNEVKFHPDLAGLKVVRGFSGENTFSFQLLKYPEYYLSIGSEGASKDNLIPYKELIFTKNSGKEEWKKNASFRITNGKAFTKWISLESTAFPGWYVAVEPDKFKAMPNDFKDFDDIRKFSNEQKRTALVLVEFAEKRFHRLITTFRLTAFAPENDFAKTLAERDMNENPELIDEVFSDLGKKMLAMNKAKEAMKSFKDFFKGRNELKEKRKKEKAQEKIKLINARVAETRKKFAAALKQAKSSKGKAEKIGKIKTPKNPDKNRIKSGKKSVAGTELKISGDEETLEVSNNISLAEIIQSAVEYEILPDTFEIGNLPVYEIGIRDGAIVYSPANKTFSITGQAYAFQLELGHIDFRIDQSGVFCDCQTTPLLMGFSLIHDPADMKKGPKLFIEMKQGNQQIYFSGAMKVFAKADKFSAVPKSKELTVNFTQLGFEVEFSFPVGKLFFDAEIDISYEKGKESAALAATLQVGLFKTFHEYVFAGLKDKFPQPIQDAINELFYPVSFTLSASGDKNSVTLGYEVALVVSGKEVEFGGEVELNDEIIASIVRQGMDKIMAELGKAFGEVGEFGTLVWGEISSGAVAGVELVRGLGNVVAQQATRIAQQTQVFFQQGVEEAKQVISVVTDAVAGTMEKAKEYIEASMQKLGDEIVKFGYAVCEWLIAEIYR